MRRVGAWIVVAAATAALLAPSAARADGLELQAGRQELSLTAGHGFFLPFDVFEDRTDAPFVFLQPSWSRFLGPRNELIVGTPVLLFYRSDDATAAGATAAIRHHFAHRGRWLPFFEAGAGGLVTDLAIRELGGDFQFMLHAGFGVRYRTDAVTSLILAGKWFHMSNGGLRSPNTGKDNATVSLSYSRAF